MATVCSSLQVLWTSQFACGFTLSVLCIIFILMQLKFQSQSQILAWSVTGH